MVSPLRFVQKLSQLNSYEIADLFNCVQLVESKLAKFYKTSSSTVCIQDGPEAGQTVKHLHVHILPRRRGDFEHNDEIYSVVCVFSRHLSFSVIIKMRNNSIKAH
ncbi:Bis(5'-adenosyl)-triphosphatase [Trichinella spiralis]|uniref:Bis(5'-adenosyl)-triphosphatase n=1 Tax=Trichinella spiralis TaxID=6334 RepID=UPI0001EFBC3C|nr:Bis(5'-adenosyl)-triphosphatase [Trichinella spiralis]